MVSQQLNTESRINELGSLAATRREKSESGNMFAFELHAPDMAYLTEAEKEELHELKQALPSSRYLAEAAKERLKSRRRGRPGK